MSSSAPSLAEIRHSRNSTLVHHVGQLVDCLFNVFDQGMDMHLERAISTWWCKLVRRMIMVEYHVMMAMHP